jgi:hypothetical protein
MAYSIAVQQGGSTDENNYSNTTTITPRCKVGINITTASSNDTHLVDLGDITPASVSDTAGIQFIGIQRDVAGTAKIRNSSSADLISIAMTAGQTVLGAISDTGTSIPVNFTVPTSGDALHEFFFDKTTTTDTGNISIEIFFNRPITTT